MLKSKTPVLSLFWDKVEIKLQAIRSATLLKRDSNTPVLKNICIQLLLKIIIKKDFLEKSLVIMIIA